MALTLGTRLGVYEITAPIGEGGMGQVYRATDTRLKRQVAIKIVPPSLATDADRLARFQREAEVLASLNHPNIAAIYGLEESGGLTALVMELVEGEDLSQRIAHGPMPLDEALPIAKQIAEALEAAHEQGIIHRDLKPANIKVRQDGTVKVLDFGLAKPMEPVGGAASNVSQSPTITTPAMTQAGMIMGTAAYMSPEQAKGRPVDKRTDVWAFGAVLYEMFTGRRAFEGDDVSDTLARILMEEPDWTALPATIPPAVVTVLRRCLQKDRKQRVRDIGDVSLALEGAFETAAPQTTAPATSSSPRGRLAWMAAFGVAAAVIVALAVPAVRYLRETPPPAAPETRLDILTPATADQTSFALSPDGRQIVFVAVGESGGSRLWLRALGATGAQALAGTEGATFPFWAPDSRAVAFFAGSALKRLDLGTGAPRALAAVTTARGGTWNADGVIVFAPATNSPLFRVSAGGGPAAAMTTLDGHTSHRFPVFLPDGRHLLFYAQGPPETAGIHLGAVDTKEVHRVTSAADGAGFYLSGWLLWVQSGTLVAQRLDLAQPALTGDLVTVAEGVTLDSLNGSAVSVSAAGLVAYRAGGGSRRQLVWVDRSGRALGTLGAPDVEELRDPSVSPDGHRVVVARTVHGNQDLWLLDGARPSRITFDAARDHFPIWSPDGQRIAFQSNRRGFFEIYQKSADGAAAEDRLVASRSASAPSDWSANGQFLLYFVAGGPQTRADLWVRPMTGDPTPWVFLKTAFSELWGQFSPDGRFVAYESNESGHNEIHVRPFRRAAAADTEGGHWQISTAGGIYPRWRADGKELYYLDPAGRMLAAPITVTGATLAPGAPVALFPTKIVGGGVDDFQGRQYDVTRDGRFLINTVLDEGTAPITLLQNWHPDAKK